MLSLRSASASCSFAIHFRVILLPGANRHCDFIVEENLPSNKINN